MKCDICKINSATYHSRTNINGRVSEVHLCNECLEKSNYNPFSVFTNNLFDTGHYMFERSIDAVKDSGAACKKCGTTLSQILNLGKLGCTNCYTQFKDKIMYAIGSLNYGDKHIGKSVDSAMPKDDTELKLAELKNKLKKLVSEEKYEEAAILKKEIDSLKAGDSNEK